MLHASFAFAPMKQGNTIKLLHCQKLQDLGGYLPPQTPEITNALYGPYEQLKSTSNFYYKASGRMAPNLRSLVG